MDADREVEVRQTKTVDSSISVQGGSLGLRSTLQLVIVSIKRHLDFLELAQLTVSLWKYKIHERKK